MKNDYLREVVFAPFLKILTIIVLVRLFGNLNGSNKYYGRR